jgi:hypothetical protein
MKTDPDEAGPWEPFAVQDQAAGQRVAVRWVRSPKLGERRIFPCAWDGDHTWTAVADGGYSARRGPVPQPGRRRTGAESQGPVAAVRDQARAIRLAMIALTADQMREALYWHFAGRCAVLFEVATDARQEQLDLPSAARGVTRWSRRRIDVLAVSRARRAGIGPVDLLAIEIKVSRSDFLTELRNPAKQARWREVAHRHAFAVPDGLVRPEEIPAGSGLLAVTPPPPHGYRYGVRWSLRTRHDGNTPPIPAWLVLAFAYRSSAAEAKLLGISPDSSHAGESIEDLRAALIAERAHAGRLAAKLSRTADEAAAWRAAFAAAGGTVPCRHCGQAVRPVRLRGGAFSAWRHAYREHDAPCDEIRSAAGAWAQAGPEDDDVWADELPADARP